MTEHQHSPAGGGEAESILDFRPSIGAPTPEPAIREIVRSFFGCHIDGAAEALRLTKAYCAAVEAKIAAGPPPETIAQASLFTSAEILAALRIVRDAPPPQYGAAPVERWTWDMTWVTRGDWRRGDGRYRLTPAGAAALLVGEMWEGASAHPSVASGDGGGIWERAAQVADAEVRRAEEQIRANDEYSARGPLGPSFGSSANRLCEASKYTAEAIAKGIRGFAAQRPAPAQAPETAGGAMFPIPPIAERDAELKTLRAQIDAYFSERGAATPSAAPGGSDRERVALKEITEAAEQLLLTLPGHWHDDATIRLTDAAEDARKALDAAEQDDLYEVADLTPQPTSPGAGDVAPSAAPDLETLAALSAAATQGEASFEITPSHYPECDDADLPGALRIGGAEVALVHEKYGRNVEPRYEADGALFAAALNYVRKLLAARSGALRPTTATPPAGAEARREEIAEALWRSDNPEPGAPTWREWIKYVEEYGNISTLTGPIDDCRRRAEAVRALAPAPSVPERSFQERNVAWMRHVFFDAGDPTDLAKRRDRFAEEALELIQATGGTLDGIIAQATYTFGREPGEPRQEAGGTMTTLACLATLAGFDLAEAGEAELARCWRPEVIAKVQRKRANRHGRGVLPGDDADLVASPPASGPAQSAEERT